MASLERKIIDAHRKEQEKDIRCFSFETDCYIVHLYFIEDELSEEFSSKPLLLQESNVINLGRGKELFFHRNNYTKPHDPAKDHLHFCVKGKEIFSINRDGTAHDGNHGILIPRDVFNTIVKRFPDFNLPKNRLIESLELTDSDLSERISILLE